MLIDSLNTFLESGDMANAVGTANLGDVIDLGAEPKRNIANGEALWVVMTVVTAPTNGAATFQLKVVSDAQDPITTDGSETVHILSPEFATADLPAGKVVAFPLSKGIKYERFLGVQLVTGGGTETTFVGDVHLTPYGNVIWEAYADAQNDDDL